MDFNRFDSSMAGYHLVLGFRLFVHCRFVVVWWMTNMRSFCFIIAFHSFATLENWLTYQCPSSWLVVITMKKKISRRLKKKLGYWPVQMNGNKFATGQILRKPVEVVKGWILAGWGQKSPEPWGWGWLLQTWAANKGARDLCRESGKKATNTKSWKKS